MAARGQLQNFLWAQKLKKLTSEIIQIFTLSFPTIWRWACDFFKVLPKFKMATMHKLHKLHNSKTQKLKSEILCLVILLKFKMATTNRLFKYL